MEKLKDRLKVIEWDNLAGKAGSMRAISALSAMDRDFRNKIGKAARKGKFKNIHRQALPFIIYLMRDYVYTQDPAIEYYIEPKYFIENKLGDCDDSAIFTAAVLTVCRVPNEFVFIFEKDGGFLKLKHVYNRARIRDRCVDIDFSRGNKAGHPLVRIRPKGQGRRPDIEHFSYKINERIIRALKGNRDAKIKSRNSNSIL